MKKFIYLFSFLFSVSTLTAQDITGQSEVNSIACNGGVATWSFNTNATTNFIYQVQAFSSGTWGNFGPSVNVTIPANSFSVSNLFAGQFRIILFDISNLPSDTSDIFMVNQPAPLFNSFSNLNSVSCFGGSDGSATVNPNGGTAPYTYLWSNGQTTQTATNLLPSTYNCIVTDANSCPSITISVTITQPSSPLSVPTPITTNVSCFGGIDGTATANPNGGTAPYTYLWSNGSINNPLTGLSSGAYSCLVTDANGCFFSIPSIIITQPSSPLSVSSTATTNVSCFGGSDGSATVNPNGGTFPYSYLWSNGSTNNPSNGLSLGTYSCLVTDANGCFFSVSSVNINQPLSPLTVPIPTTTNVSCFGGSDGSATVNPNGGTAPYTYSWSNGQTTQTATNLLPSTYTCTVTDANGCIFTAPSIFIIQPSSLSASSSTTLVSCFGGSDGSVTLTLSGGIPPYSINFLTYSLTLPNLVSTPMVIPAGTYPYSISDNQGCNFTANVTVFQPLSSLTAILTKTDVSCLGSNDGTATVTASGGTAPYTYLWSNGQTTQTATNLLPNIYTCVITDINGCIFTTPSVSITQPLVLTATTSKTNVSCFGGNDGTIIANPSGGTAPYIYSWSNGQTTQNIINLSSGIYNCVIIDANGCNVSKTVTILQPLSQLILPTPTHTNVSCFGGSDGTATANASGGVAPYTYFWSSGGQSTQTAIGLPVGSFYSTITDANGCITSTSVTITQAQPLQVQISATDVSCNNGSDAIATALPSGGTAPYTYIWFNGTTSSTVGGLSAANYSVVVTDANNCPSITTTVLINEPLSITAIGNIGSVSCSGGGDGEILLNVSGGNAPYTYLWSNTQTSQNATGLVAGNYTVAIYDVTCNIPTFFSASVAEPSPLSATASVLDAKCFGESSGSISLTPIGGTPSYNYSWSNGQASQVLSNAAFGIYDCVITDFNGCYTSVQATIDQPQELILSSPSTVSTSCFGYNDGSASVIPQGGTAPYYYFWSNSQTTQTSQNLVAGSYSVLVADANNCLVADTLNVDQPVQIIASLASTDVLCNGDASGNIIVSNVSGTIGSTSYLWSNGHTSFFNQNLVAGTYYLTVSDTNGCFNTFSSTISEPSVISTVFSYSDISVTGANDGNISAIISGGNPPYSFSWAGPNSFFSNSSIINGLDSGQYTLTVTDFDGCSREFIQVINEPDCGFIISQTYTAPLCYGTPASVYWENNGGLAPYSNTLTNSDGVVIINGAQYQYPNTPLQLSNGVYNLVVTDAAGCIEFWNIDVIYPDSIVVDLTLTDALCNGSNNGTVTELVSGGSGSYNINWGGSNPNLLSAGSYNMEVTDANGCSSGVINFIIGDPSQLLIDSISTTEISCLTGNDGTATIFGSGGILPYTYLWSNGQTSQMAQSLINGNYIATIIDANNCQVSNNLTIVNATPLIVNIIPTEVSCVVSNDGALSADIVSGTGPITYNWFNTPSPPSTGLNVISSDSLILNLSTGWYSLLATDVNGCISTPAYHLLNPNPISFTLNANDITSNGANDGSINTIGPSGGQAPYSYFWTGDNGFTSVSQNLVALPLGGYTLTVTDANGCEFSQSTAINEPDCNVDITWSTIQPLCYGDNGSITWSSSGGVPSYQNIITDLTLSVSLLNNFGSTGAFSLGEGTYELKVTDQFGCIDIINETITEPDPVIANYTTSDVSCYGGSDGEIIVDPIGGTGIYIINYSSLNPSQLSAGIYSFNVADDNGCQSVPFSNSYVINEPTDIIVTTSSTPVDCFNGNNGTATVTAVGGVLPYSFFWNSSGFVTSSLNNLPEGSYFVTVTDANGCPSIAPVVVLQPATTLSGSIMPTDVSCYSLTDGMATVNPTGGTAPYGYFWSNGQTTQTATGLSAGIYTCIITDANGCVNTLNTLINEPNEILAGLNTIPASCYGFNDGAASVNPNGGTSPYTYLWSNSSTNSSIQNLSIGSYSVAVTDVDGCGTTSSPVIFTISQADSLTLTTSSTSVSCFNGNNGTANVIVSGGTPNYNYTWLDILGNTISTNSIANGLISDSFSIIVSDLNGCSDTALVIISSASELLTNISTSPATCFEGDDGSAIASPSGGTPPYNYLWIGGQSSTNTLEYTGLNSATTYYFSLQDANACSIFNDSVNISEPLAISMSFDVLDVNCFGGSDGEVIVHASGGTSPYEFSYQNILFTTDSIFTNLNAGWFNAYLVDANGCLSSDSIEVISPLVIDPNIFPLNSLTCSGGNDGHLASAAQGGVSPYTYFWSTFSNNYEILALSEGSYTVNVTDNNGCVASETFILSPDFEITSTTSTTLVSCIGASDGTAIIQASGGTSPYFYSWNDGSINFSTNDTIIGLSPGLYACVITDANGCIGYDTINIIESTTSLVIDSSLTNSVSCFAGSDGSAIVYASGGIGNYTYQWDDINLQTSQQAVGLTIGTFIVTVTDSALCTVTETVIISEPLQLDITIIESDISCYGFLDGTLISSVVGGTGPYILSWVGPNLYTNSLSTIENLATGSYTLTVTDNNACQDTVSSLISEPTPLSFTTDVTNPSCYNDADGIIDIQISGGIQPYNAIYLSGNNSYPNANSIIISGLSVGSDTLYVTDLNGCQKTSFITLLQPLALQISNITEVDPTCYNYNDGSVSIVVTGGNLPYTYQLLDENGINIGMTSNTNGLADGIYTYIVNDLNGCTDSSQFSITIPDQIAITQLQSCYGSILLEISSFNSNYQIFWDNAPDSVFIADLSSGTYNATVIDSLGCTNTESFIVNDPFSFTIYDATCFSVSDGSIMLENLNGGFPPYSLSVNNELVFDNILGEILLDNLPVTNYQLLLTDNGGCTILDSLLVVNYIGGSNCVNTPIIISPNSDGTNDTWKPASDIDEEISVTIYNRWGQIEFFAKENSQILEWDGTTTEGRFLPTADYYFVIHFINQYTMPDKTGVITLIR